MKFLIKKSLILKLIEISFIFMCCKKEIEIGYLEISFKDFISQNTIESDFEFNDIKRKKKKIGISIKVSLKIRKALGEEEYDINVKTTKEIMRVFQPFKGDPIENYDVPSSNYIKNYIPKKTITNQTVTNNNKNNAQNTQMKKNNTQKKEKPKIEGVTYTKDDFTEEELEDPTNTDIIVTAKSLEFEIKKLDEKCAKIEGRIPKELRDKKNKMTCQKNILENMLGDTISPQQYAGMVHDSLEHHRKLQKYFQDHNEIEKEKIVTDRINILLSELTEVLNLIQK